MKKRIEVKVTGLVQGVNFRYYCFQEAARLGLVGSVENLGSGDEVKVVAEGEESDLRKLIEWLKNGSEYAQVKKIEIEQKDYSGNFKNFEII